MSHDRLSLDALEDRDLVLRAQDGEVAAFEALIDRHQGILFRVAMATARMPRTSSRRRC